MTTQPNVGALLTYGAQAAYGTAAVAGDPSQRLRRVTSNLALAKDGFTSNEVRGDQQVSDARHGGHRVGGGVSGELSTVTWNDWLAALMRTSWVSGVSKSQADFTSLTIAGGVITAGSSSFKTMGFKIGDIVVAGGLSVTANNGVRTRITAMATDGSTITTFPALADNATDSVCTLAVVGKKAIVGTTETPFTIEQNYPTSDISERFDSCYMGGASIRLPPNNNASIDWDIMGQKMTKLSGGSAPYFSSVTDAPTTGLLTGIGGKLRLAGAEQSIVTSLDLQISNNLNAAPVIGSVYLPRIFFGRFVVTGSVSYYLDDATLLDAFLNETEVDLVASAEDATGEFLSFNMQRVKLMGAQKQIGADGGVIFTSPFQALLKSGGSGTAYDQSTLVIQRSDS